LRSASQPASSCATHIGVWNCPAPRRSAPRTRCSYALPTTSTPSRHASQWLGSAQTSCSSFFNSRLRATRIAVASLLPAAVRTRAMRSATATSVPTASTMGTGRPRRLVARSSVAMCSGCTRSALLRRTEPTNLLTADQAQLPSTPGSTPPRQRGRTGRCTSRSYATCQAWNLWGVVVMLAYAALL
jgi:hypothetical protein